MFAFPSYGIHVSRDDNHNSKLEVFCDWLETSILFDDNEISRSDIVDVLTEDGLYIDQDLANDWVEQVWAEILRRQKCLGNGTPFEIDAQKIKRLVPWNTVPAHSFCLILSMVQYYSGLYKEWQKKFKKGYNEQGELFELLTEESLKQQFVDWSLYRTGWTKSKAEKLDEIVDQIIERLGEAKGDVGKWTSPQANEEGLDILFYRPFVDSRVGIPLYLVQCASGKNWDTKLHTPDINVWKGIVQFAATPRKAFSTPLSFDESDFIRYTRRVDGLLLDRYRLLIPASKRIDWVPVDLKARIEKWVKPRLKTFPTLN